MHVWNLHNSSAFSILSGDRSCSPHPQASHHICCAAWLVTCCSTAQHSILGRGQAVVVNLAGFDMLSSQLHAGSASNASGLLSDCLKACVDP
jgi:hypothetical protein